MSTIMKLLYGTGNPAKLSVMRKKLEDLGIELIGLHDLDAEIPSVAEDGRTPLENARQKALAYYDAFGIPVFSCDSGLYFEGVPDEVQPGVHVRTVHGKSLTDEEMLDYYSGLAKKYGDLTATYKNAICFVMDAEHIYEAMEPSMESERFIITEKPHDVIRKQGFPLDSLSIDIKSGKYYYDLSEKKLDQVAVEDGFLDFFRNLWIILFLIRAKKATYAGKGAETSSSRTQSHDLIYQEDDYMYYDSYLGGEKFAGEEALWIREKPYWSMNYIGRVTGEHFSGDFLKEALFHVPVDQPYRGPEEYTDGNYSYQCRVTGDFAWFQGHETISFQGQGIYECYFHGGLIR